MNVLKKKNKKVKTIAVFLCICLITGLSMNQTALLQFVKADEFVWTGILPIATKSFEGKGTAASPYYIDTAEDLAQFAYNVNNGMYTDTMYFQLRNDININNNEWVSIGNQHNNFTGMIMY